MINSMKLATGRKGPQQVSMGMLFLMGPENLL